MCGVVIIQLIGNDLMFNPGNLITITHDYRVIQGDLNLSRYKARPVIKPSQQSRDVYPMLFYCWASVADGGPTLTQHRINVSYLLPSQLREIVWEQKEGKSVCNMVNDLGNLSGEINCLCIIFIILFPRHVCLESWHILAKLFYHGSKCES